MHISPKYQLVSKPFRNNEGPLDGSKRRPKIGGNPWGSQSAKEMTCALFNCTGNWTRQPSAVDRPCVGRAVTWSMELNHWIEEHGEMEHVPVRPLGVADLGFGEDLRCFKPPLV